VQHAEDFTIGVEEEYQILHPETRELRQRASRILPEAQRRVGDEVTNELYLSQIEIGTPVCRSLADVRAELVRLRRAVIAAASRDGSRIAAAGTHPFSHWEEQALTAHLTTIPSCSVHSTVNPPGGTLGPPPPLGKGR
jgi:carboxylate-amine ligase